MTLNIEHITFDCHDPQQLAAFWSAATGQEIADDWGGFVRLAPGIEGLIHVSELAHHRVTKVSSIVKQGQEIEVKVISVDREAQRMALSLKALVTVPEPKKDDKDAEIDESPPEPTVPEFKGELKGGTNRPTGGDQFGLKW